MKENERLRMEIGELKIQLLRSDERNGEVEEGGRRLKEVLTPLYTALQHVFGDLDAVVSNDASGAVGAASDARVSPVWESWKQKLGGKAADAIDALMVHGELTHTQLRIHIKCGQQTVYDTVLRLNKAGIINKNGGKISLKKL
jgi:hypothetical protein